MVSFAMLWLLASRGKDGVERICRVALLACQIRLGVSAMGVECVAPVCKGGGEEEESQVFTWSERMQRTCCR
jgi:hypothetical protein